MSRKRITRIASFWAVILALLLPSIQSLAQTPEIHLKHLTLDQGLSANDVHSIIQDRKGFIWLATFSGLSRYDGNSVTVFRHDSKNPKSISSDLISRLLVDHRGTLWIGTSTEGICRYNDMTGEFIPFRSVPDGSGLSNNSIHAMLEDHSGKLWIGTEGGLDEFDPETNSVVHFKSDAKNPGSLPNGYILSLCQDHNGAIWVGTYMGLARLDSGKSTFTVYHDRWQDPHALLNGTVSALFEDHRNVLWIGTMGGGLHSFDPSTDSFNRYRLKPGPGTNINHLEDDFIRSIYEDRSHALWIATQEGLVRFHRKTQKAIFYKNDPADPASLADNFVMAIFEDGTENLWIGTSTSGVDRLDLKAKQFVVYHHLAGDSTSITADHVKSLFIDHEGVLWVGTWLGWLNRYDSAKHGFTHIIGNTWDTTSLSSSIIYTMMEDKENNLWVGTAWGMDMLNRKTGRFHRWFPPYISGASGGKRDVFPYNIYKIIDDGSGGLWIATNNGLFNFSPSRKAWQSWLHKEGDANSPANNFIISMLLDSTGALWLGTPDGLDRFTPKDGKFTHFRNDPSNDMSISSNLISDIYQASNGVLWFGTSVGIDRFDSYHNSFERLTESEGLGCNSVDHIREDSKGNLWISTDRGLTRFDPVTRSIRNLTSGDGLQRGEFEQSAGATDRFGKLYFGGVRGFTIFSPDSIKENPYFPPVVITSVLVLKNGVWVDKEINMAPTQFLHDENIVTFEFSALEYSDPDRNEYLYRLKGFEDKWVKTGKTRSATYTNLSPGGYVFQVRASNNDGVWNDSGVSLAFSVAAPWWGTVWFRLLVVCLGGAGALGIYRLRVSRIERESNLHREFARQVIEHQESERKRISSELHDSIGQNLLVVKNRIFLGLQKRDKPEEMIKQFEMVSSTIGKTLEELRSISHNLRPYELDRLGLTDTITAAISSIMESSRIAFDQEVDPIDSLFTKEEETNIFRICQEIFNNVMKHSEADAATVRIKKGVNGVFFYFQDNGVGFDTEKIWTKGSRMRGMGLIGLEERVQIMGGTFFLSSHVGRGTTIQIAIPIHKNGVVT